MSRFFGWLDARTDYRRLLAPIRHRAVPGGASWWLTSGTVLLWLFVVEIVTGLALMVAYSPSMTSAWASVHFIDQSDAGRFLRGIHFYTSHALILAFIVHLIRILLTAAFRPPRELIWITGLLLIPLTIAWVVTGNPLSANVKGMAQIDVEGRIIASTPIVGPTIQRLLIGGNEPGNLTLTHLYFLHVGLLPLVVLTLLGFHISQVYKHGLTPLNGPDGEEVDGRAEPYWPNQTARNMAVLSVVLGVIGYLAWRSGAPLNAPADASLPHMPRPEWYFRWLFELRGYLTGEWEFLATVILPLIVLAYFLLLPMVDGKLKRGASLILRVVTVGIGISAVGGLTWASFARDWKDADFQASEKNCADLAARARMLANSQGLSVEGAVTLLRNDPKTQGPALYKRHCASCHPYIDEQGNGIKPETTSAPNLHGFGTTKWIADMLDPEKYVSPQYFGHTKFVDGEMAAKLKDMFEGAEDRAKLRHELDLAARALAADAHLHSQAAADERDAQQIADGAKLIEEGLGCSDCHHHGEVGDLGSAPDLAGYGSREWLVGIISNPQHERFYPDDRNDRMPAFASDPQKPEQNVLSQRELNLIVDWLRGEWVEEK